MVVGPDALKPQATNNTPTEIRRKAQADNVTILRLVVWEPLLSIIISLFPI